MGAGHILDTRGLKCPLPVIKLEKHLESVPPGGTVTVLADDPVARIDIPLMCRKAGHTCTVTGTGDVLSFEIAKTGRSDGAD